MLRGSFIPPAQIKAARDVLRYRTKVMQSRTSEVQRLGNVLQDAGIKIDSVASSIATKSGLSMIEALIDGERRGKVLAEAARWLASLGVTHVAMEATGIYSMPVYHALIGHGDFAQVLVCNAGHVRNVPGRKTDLADAEWLAHLPECGLLAGSCIPPAEIKAVRDVFRYRTLCRYRHSIL